MYNGALRHTSVEVEDEIGVDISVHFNAAYEVSGLPGGRLVLHFDIAQSDHAH
jgi:hypothetical protein